MTAPNTSAPANPGSIRTLTKIKDVQAKAPQWLWPKYIPLGKLAMLDGDPGLGKSTLLLDLAARVSRGSTMPDGSPGVQGSVIILSAEDDPEDTIKPRLECAQAEQDHIFLLAGVGDRNRGPVQIPRDLDSIDELARQHDARLLILDPLMAFLGGVDANRDQAIRRVLFELASIANQRRCAVICVRHLNKREAGKAIYRGTSSIALIGHARTGLLVAQDPDDPTHRVLAVAKCNVAAPPPSVRFTMEQLPTGIRINWRGTSPYDADRLVSRPPTEEDRLRMSSDLKCQEFLRQTLHGCAMPVQSLRAESEDAGFAWRSVQRAAQTLGVVLQRKYGMNMWCLPNAEKPST